MPTPLQRGLSFEALAAAPRGIVYDVLPLRVAAPSTGSANRLDLCPADVALEIDEVAARLRASDDESPYRPASRLVPEDMRREAFVDEATICIRSSHGEITTAVIGDPTVRLASSRSRMRSRRPRERTRDGSCRSPRATASGSASCRIKPEFP